MFKPTITVTTEAGIAVGDRLEFSSGSVAAEDARYEPGAVIPRRPWRQVLVTELKLMSAPEDENINGRSIKILKFPSYLIEEFHRIVAKPGKENIRVAASSIEANKILVEFNRFAQTIKILSFEFPAKDLHGGFCVSDPGLKTITIDESSGRLIGLHVDDWFRRPVGRRIQSPPRICGNFGWCDRFLLFLPIALDDVYLTDFPGAYDWKGRDWRSEVVNRKGASALARQFLRSFDGFPIARIRIRPGEAYLATTENLIHDGSSEYGVHEDVACHIHAAA